VFIQIIQGRATNPDGIRTELDRWKAELAPGADGWLGSTAGITDDGYFIAVVRFASEELARRNSDRPEQDAWWNQLAQHLAEVAFHDSTRVRTPTSRAATTRPASSRSSKATGLSPAGRTPWLCGQG
jgi:hypothetical protein